MARPGERLLTVGYGWVRPGVGEHRPPAVADIVHWAKSDSRVSALVAETAPGTTLRSMHWTVKVPKGRERVDEEDGLLLCWRLETPS